MSEPIISVSGLRGIVGEQLTPLVAVRYAAAFCATRPKGSIVLGNDGRTTARIFVDAVRSTLLASGFEVLDAGIVDSDHGNPGS